MVKENEINLEFSSEVEKKYHDINMELKKYETKINSMFKEKNYCKIIANGTNIIEQMLELILKRKNNLPNSQISMIEHTIKTKIIPIKTKNTLFEINRITHEINEKNVNYNQTQKFLKTFKKFIKWFNTEKELYDLKIDNCIKLIDNLPNTEPAINNRSEENDPINKINESLENLDKYLKLVSKENYAGAVIEGYNVCNLMLELFLKNEGYIIENSVVLQGDEKTPIIQFCTQHNLFPKECNEFLKVINEYNEFLKLDNSYMLALSFLKGLSYFILWFNNFYSEKYSTTKPFKIENCYAEISKLTYNQEDNKIFKIRSSNTKKQKSEISIDNGLPVNFQDNVSNMDLLQAIYKIGEEIKNHVTEEAEKIRKEIKNIALKITDYQSLIERQINNFDTEEEKDKIIAAFADECAERIINETTFNKEEDSYNFEKTNLINSLGKNAWDKLSEESQTYLISSKLMFNNLNDINEIVDYSGVCILITKTLEVELYKRFYDNFLDYLDKKRYKKYDNYPTGLLYKNREPLNEDKFNLGTVAYIFCLKTDYYIDYYREKNNEEKLIEYCEADLFKENQTAIIEELIKKFGETIEKIRKDYRNPSAHRNNITKDKAAMCLDLVLYNDNPFLKEMLDSFKM